MSKEGLRRHLNSSRHRPPPGICHGELSCLAFCLLEAGFEPTPGRAHSEKPASAGERCLADA